MKTKHLIAVKDFCISHNIEISFFSLLSDNGLIEYISIEGIVYIDTNQLLNLEKFVRFYYDLDINIEGIETITHLLQRVSSMQSEITELKNRLRLYELSQSNE